MRFSLFDQRPIVVAIAGPNGAGKSTFFDAHLAAAGLRFVNADSLAIEFAIDPYEAANVADRLRKELLASGESFVFETVFSDPVGDKLAFLERAAQCGYIVVLCFVGLATPDQSVERVAMRVTQGGHDVPKEKLWSRFPRSLANLRAAILRLPNVLIFDNSDLMTPHRLVAIFQGSKSHYLATPTPTWLRSVLP